jgi:hypothetical protein
MLLNGGAAALQAFGAEIAYEGMVMTSFVGWYMSAYA